MCNKANIIYELHLKEVEIEKLRSVLIKIKRFYYNAGFYGLATETENIINDTSKLLEYAKKYKHIEQIV